MSNYESEHGTFRLPSAEFAGFRQKMQTIDQTHKERAFALTQDFWRSLTRKQQTDVNEYRKALAAWRQAEYERRRGPAKRLISGGAIAGDVPSDWVAAIDEADHLLSTKSYGGRTLNPATGRWETGQVRLGRVHKSDVDWPTNRSTRFQMGEASVSFNPKDKTVTWSVEENNHAVERAHDTALGKAFFAHLDTIRWTAGTGGYTTYDSEYHENERGQRSGAEVNNGWGYLGIEHYSGTRPFQNAKGEWVGPQTKMGRYGMVTKAVTGTTTRDRWSGRITFKPYGKDNPKPARATSPRTPVQAVPQPTSKPAAKSTAKAPVASSPSSTRTSPSTGVGRGKTTPASNAGSFKSYAHGVADIDLGPDPGAGLGLEGSDPFSNGF